MHDRDCPNHLSTQCSANRLMAQTHPEKRDFALDSMDQRYRYTGIFRSSGTGRNNNFFRGESNNPINRKPLIIKNNNEILISGPVTLSPKK